jgi:membrane protease YdiL (CAAX protease family)
MWPMIGLAWRFWERYFGEPLRKVEAESLAYRLSDEGRRADWRTPAVLVVAAACLILQQYTSHPASVVGPVRFLVAALDGPDAAGEAEATLRAWGYDPLATRLWWAGVAVVTYAAIPLLLLAFVFRDSPRNYGLKVRGALDAWPLYAIMVGVMAPLVYVFSATEHFQGTYPFVRFASPEQVRAGLWKWELAYAAQFVGLEFFFRGFVVHGTKHRFGVYSVFVAMVPYVQIHLGKPMPEATASLVAGVVLGVMSLVTRSVWLGAALHIGVAWGMDCACLYRRGLL